MIDIHTLLRSRLHARAGLTPPPPARFTLDQLERSQWSHDFERLMRNRMIMGALRYGVLGAPGKPQYDRIPSIIKRLKLYERDGNTEHLVDAANLCLCEFVEGTHPLKHFGSVDDCAAHCEPRRP